jgi:hypothetical protein
VEVVDGLDVEAFRCAYVFENLPVRACGPTNGVSGRELKRCKGRLTSIGTA